ncbi:MAG: hypothetical protein EOO70_06210 [Myxococcaceae bacterium]|nr:MAG: hypothetical protein EOO70_06210 [Myxococcaceae bacterium]
MDPETLDSVPDGCDPPPGATHEDAEAGTVADGLPAGEKNKKLRQFVYDEKNLYLRQGIHRPDDGSIVGADSRQSRLQFLREAYAATNAWATRGGSANDIFLEYYDLNKKMRFR